MALQDIVCLVEGARTAGIRFVYFSSESEQRSRVSFRCHSRVLFVLLSVTVQQCLRCYNGARSSGTPFSSILVVVSFLPCVSAMYAAMLVCVLGWLHGLSSRCRPVGYLHFLFSTSHLFCGFLVCVPRHVSRCFQAGWVLKLAGIVTSR